MYNVFGTKKYLCGSLKCSNKCLPSNTQACKKLWPFITDTKYSETSLQILIGNVKVFATEKYPLFRNKFIY